MRGQRRTYPALANSEDGAEVLLTHAHYSLPCAYAAESAGSDMLNALSMWVDCLTETSATNRFWAGFPWLRVGWTAVISVPHGSGLREIDRVPLGVQAIRLERNPSAMGRSGLAGDTSTLRFGFPDGPDGYSFRGRLDSLPAVHVVPADDGTSVVAPVLQIARFAPAFDLGFALMAGGYGDVADRMWSRWKRIVRDGGARKPPKRIELGPLRSHEEQVLYKSRF